MLRPISAASALMTKKKSPFREAALLFLSTLREYTLKIGLFVRKEKAIPSRIDFFSHKQIKTHMDVASAIEPLATHLEDRQ